LFSSYSKFALTGEGQRRRLKKLSASFPHFIIVCALALLICGRDNVPVQSMTCMPPP
jgi:hypothetical protein